MSENDKDIMEFIMDRLSEIADAIEEDDVLSGMLDVQEAFERNPLLQICVTEAYPTPQAFLN